MLIEPRMLYRMVLHYTEIRGTPPEELQSCNKSKSNVSTYKGHCQHLLWRLGWQQSLKMGIHPEWHFGGWLQREDFTWSLKQNSNTTSEVSFTLEPQTSVIISLYLPLLFLLLLSVSFSFLCVDSLSTPRTSMTATKSFDLSLTFHRRYICGDFSV